MAYDFKKAFPEYYLPKGVPAIVEVPRMQFAAVRGRGDPNEPEGEYQRAVGILYAVAYGVKMMKRGSEQPEGYFDFVVPPLEGFWWQPGIHGIDYSRKQDFEWIACIRMPDFVSPQVFECALEAAKAKKGPEAAKAQLMTLEEGLCVQAMHMGPYDDEPATEAAMSAYIAAQGYVYDFSDARRHHEIYLSDPRRTVPERLKTVLRAPVRSVND